MTAEPVVVEAVEQTLAAASANGTRPKSAGGWPVLDPAARHGLIGEIVAAIEPHSEADPAGLLFALLAEAGVIIGPAPHAVADSAEHPARLFVVNVGNTSKGRKGSIEANVGRVSRMIDPEFAAFPSPQRFRLGREPRRRCPR